jgi:hypothetical protein
MVGDKSICRRERKRVSPLEERERGVFGVLSHFWWAFALCCGVWCLELVVFVFASKDLGEFVLANGIVGELDLALDGLEEPLEADDEDIVEDFLLGHAFEAGVLQLLDLVDAEARLLVDLGPIGFPVGFLLLVGASALLLVLLVIAPVLDGGANLCLCEDAGVEGVLVHWLERDNFAVLLLVEALALEDAGELLASVGLLEDSGEFGLGLVVVVVVVIQQVEVEVEAEVVIIDNFRGDFLLGLLNGSIGLDGSPEKVVCLEFVVNEAFDVLAVAVDAAPDAFANHLTLGAILRVGALDTRLVRPGSAFSGALRRELEEDVAIVLRVSHAVTLDRGDPGAGTARARAKKSVHFLDCGFLGRLLAILLLSGLARLSSSLGACLLGVQEDHNLAVDDFVPLRLGPRAVTEQVEQAFGESLLLGVFGGLEGEGEVVSHYGENWVGKLLEFENCRELDN